MESTHRIVTPALGSDMARLHLTFTYSTRSDPEKTKKKSNMFMLASKNTVALLLSRSLLTFGRISLEETERHFTGGNVFFPFKEKIKIA